MKTLDADAIMAQATRWRTSTLTKSSRSADW